MSEEIKESYLKLPIEYVEFYEKDLKQQIEDLQQKVEQLEKELQTNVNKCNQLENIRKEAIEYIRHEWFKREQIGIAPLDFSYEELQDLLNILNKGDNKE